MSPRWMVLVATSSSGETVPLQPNQRPPRPLSNERTATARPPAWLLSWLGTATRLETTISRANIDPPSCATAASQSRSGRPSNRSAESFPTKCRFADRYPPTASHSDCDMPTHQRTGHAPLRDDQATTKHLRAKTGKSGRPSPASRSRPPNIAHNVLLAQKFTLHRFDGANK